MHPVGPSFVSLSVPVSLLLFGVMLFSGKSELRFDTLRGFLLFAICATLSTVGGAIWPDSRGGFSIASFAEVLLVYTPFISRPNKSFDTRVVLNIFLKYARVIACFGIVQFCIQFVGIRIFYFGSIFPQLDPILLEGAFNFDPVISYGSEIRRSNGFFLLEPSMFSQMLATAIVVDLFVLGRKKFIPLYVVAYMTSLSGTGLFGLLVTLAFTGWTSRRNFLRVVGMAGAAVVIAAAFAVIAPDIFARFTDRFGELNSEGSSGYARYVLPFVQIQQMGGELRSIFGYGPGSSARSIYFAEGSANPVLQLFVDYGIVGLVCFTTFLTKSLWSSAFYPISVMLLAIFQIGGGYLLFTPYTLFMIALGIWSVQTSPTPEVAAPRDADARQNALQPLRLRMNRGTLLKGR